MLSPGIFLFSVPQVSFHRPTLNNDPPWPSIIANIVRSPYTASHLDLTWRRLQVMTEPSEHGQTLVWKMHPCRMWHVVFENGIEAGTYLHTDWEPITSGTLHPRRHDRSEVGCPLWIRMPNSHVNIRYEQGLRSSPCTRWFPPTEGTKIWVTSLIQDKRRKSLWWNWRLAYCILKIWCRRRYQSALNWTAVLCRNEHWEDGPLR